MGEICSAVRLRGSVCAEFAVTCASICSAARLTAAAAIHVGRYSARTRTPFDVDVAHGPLGSTEEAIYVAICAAPTFAEPVPVSCVMLVARKTTFWSYSALM
jgi:hypothetical protein